MGLSQGPGATFPEIVKPQPSLGFPEPRLGEGSSAAGGGGTSPGTTVAGRAPEWWLYELWQLALPA